MSKQIVNGPLKSPGSDDVSDGDSSDDDDVAQEVRETVRNFNKSNNSNGNDNSNANKENIDDANKDGIDDNGNCNVHKPAHQYNLRSCKNNNDSSNDINIDKDTGDNKSDDDNNDGDNNDDAHKSPSHAKRRVGHQWFDMRVRSGLPQVAMYNDGPIKFTFAKIKTNEEEETMYIQIEHETPGVIVKDGTGSYGVSFVGYDGIYFILCTL